MIDMAAQTGFSEGWGSEWKMPFPVTTCDISAQDALEAESVSGKFGASDVFPTLSPLSLVRFTVLMLRRRRNWEGRS